MVIPLIAPQKTVVKSNATLVTKNIHRLPRHDDERMFAGYSPKSRGVTAGRTRRAIRMTKRCGRMRISFIMCLENKKLAPVTSARNAIHRSGDPRWNVFRASMRALLHLSQNASGNAPRQKKVASREPAARTYQSSELHS